jgi:hypothetical protein
MESFSFLADLRLAKPWATTAQISTCDIYNSFVGGGG